MQVIFYQCILINSKKSTFVIYGDVMTQVLAMNGNLKNGSYWNKNIIAYMERLEEIKGVNGIKIYNILGVC